MDMEYPKDDFMVLDVENVGTGRERDRERNRSMLDSAASTPDSHAITLNGFGGRGSPRKSTPTNHRTDTPPSLLQHARNPTLHPPSFSTRKSHPLSDQDSSDDLALDAMPRTYKFPAATLPTGLCYDVRMRYHCELDPPKQRLDFHPEDPRRIYSIYKELCLAGLVDDKMSTQPIVSRPLQRVNARNATQAEICLVHDIKHFNFIEKTKGSRPILHDFLTLRLAHDACRYE